MSATYLISEAAISAVPLPASAWLFGSAIVGLMGLARRKRVSGSLAKAA